MKLSIIIPVFNEKETLIELLEKVQQVEYEKEIILVDDGSSDGTVEIIKKEIKDENVKKLYHSKNKGKGAALRTGIQAVTGDIVIIQDADLEYDPEDYPKLVRPIMEKKVDVVYGSRFKGQSRAMFFWHYIGNKFLSLITNLLYNVNLTDMETCYKAFRAEVIKNITIRSNRFDFEPEITAKILKRGCKLFEVPISYYGRDYEEGKKITWRDGFAALWTLVKYRFID